MSAEIILFPSLHVRVGECQCEKITRSRGTRVRLYVLQFRLSCSLPINRVLVCHLVRYSRFSLSLLLVDKRLKGAINV